MNRRSRPLALLAAFALLAPAAAAQTMQLVNPATTGIPGEEVRIVRFAPDGLLWVGARWPFWSDGGIGWLDRDTNLWTAWSNNDGSFPSAFPNDVDWAPDGAAWIATSNGLVRWKDGVQTVWTKANSPLLHDTVADVDVAPNGDVWLNNTEVNTQNAAIFRISGDTWTKFVVGGALPWALPWKQLSDVMVDHLGHAWVANETLNGVAEYDGATWTLHGAAVGRFGEVREDTAGNIWLRAGIGGGNSFWRFNHVSFKAYAPGNDPTAIGIGQDGSVYLGTWGGTIVRSTDFGQSFQAWASGLNQVFEIEPEADGTDVWVGTNGAVGRFTGTGQLVRDYNTYNTGAPDFFVDRFALDRTGAFWVASGEGGLSRFDGLQWRNWGAHNVGSEPYPFAGNEPMGTGYIDSQGTGWMGGNGIARWDPATGQFTGFWNWQNNPGMGVTMFNWFAEDLHGDLFAATEYGAIFRFNGSLWIKEPVQPYAVLGLPGMESDSQGNLWVAAWFDIWKWDGAAWTKVVLPDPDYFFDLGGINDLALGPDDVLWLGTNEGLVRWDGAAFTLYTTANSGLPTNSVKGVDVRTDGALGLACSDYTTPAYPYPNGVCVVQGDAGDLANWQVWQYGSSPLPHYQLGAAEFDGEGNLWVSAVSEGVAVVLHAAQPLSCDRPSLSASVGGAVSLALDAGAQNAGRSYVVFGSVTGTAPGLPLPGGATLPLNWDVFTDLALSLVNTPVFAAFAGTLDGAGRATATFDTLGPVPVATGLTLHFAYGLRSPWDFASNPVAVRFSP